MSDLPVHKRGERPSPSTRALLESWYPGTEIDSGYADDEEILYSFAIAWDEINPTGEGYVPDFVWNEEQNIVDVREDSYILYQWVRVTDNDGKVLGTFFLEQRDGVLVSMFLAVARKGLPPNPFDKDNDNIKMLRWERDVDPLWSYDHPSSVEEVGLRVKSFAEYRNSESYITDFADEEHTPEQIAEDIRKREAELVKAYEQRHDSRVPSAVNRDKSLWFSRGRAKNDRAVHTRLTSSIVPVPAKDDDTRFKFRIGKDSFTVRGSKLAPALLATRRANIQRVTIKQLRLVLKGLGSNGV